MADRRLTPELMDDPALNPVEHRLALAGLARLNRWSNGAGLLWPILRREATPGRPLRVLDVATGSGDIPLTLARKAARAGVPMEVAGCDVSGTAVEEASARAAELGLPVRFFRHDALRDPLPDDYDAIAASLFLHHLTDDQAMCLLRAMHRAARRLILVSDLYRSGLNLAVVSAACRLLSRSRVVRSDGPASVRAAFTPTEARGLAERAGLTGATVSVHFPSRWLLACRTPDTNPKPP